MEIFTLILAIVIFIMSILLVRKLDKVQTLLKETERERINNYQMKNYYKKQVEEARYLLKKHNIQWRGFDIKEDYNVV